MDADDDDIAHLLEELDAALIIDGISVWRLAKQSPPPATGTDQAGPRLRWDELDWAALRAHPKLAQYNMITAAMNLDPTDLQIILTAITDHFRGLGNVGESNVEIVPAVAGIADGTQMEAQTEEERAAQQAQQEQRHLSMASRNRLAWRRFVNRFLDGLVDAEFVDLLGPAVVIANALIFNHLLALLAIKDILDPEFGVTSELRLWSWMWGADGLTGFFDALTEEEQSGALQLFADRHGDAMTVAAIYDASLVTRGEGWETDRVELRDLWRGLVCSPLLADPSIVLKAAATEVAPLSASPMVALAEELAALARYHTTTELMTEMGTVLGATKGALRFNTGFVWRGPSNEQVDILEIADPTIALTADTALAAFAVWLRYEPGGDYYRADQLAEATLKDTAR